MVDSLIAQFDQPFNLDGIRRFFTLGEEGHFKEAYSSAEESYSSDEENLFVPRLLSVVRLEMVPDMHHDFKLS